MSTSSGMRIVTRTVYGAAMQTAQYLGIPYVPTDNRGTLNLKFEILSNTTPPAGSSHEVQYYVIGNGGHEAITGANGVPYTRPVPHAATDAALFNHLPFVLRPVNNDLTADQRSNYALRRTETHNGQDYYAYYAKRVPMSTVSVEMHRVMVDETTGETSETAFVPDQDNLNPTPQQVYDSNGEVIVSGEYVTGSGIAEIAFTETDAAELREVARILYDNEDMAIISEIGMVGGTDIDTSVLTTGNVEVTFSEVVAAQVTTFVAVYYQLSMQNNGFDFTADIGITEPLFAVSG